MPRLIALTALLSLGLVTQLTAQQPSQPRIPHQLLVPNALPATGQTDPVRLTHVAADVKITDQIARTALTLTLTNPDRRPHATEVVLPIPLNASIVDVACDGESLGSGAAKLLPVADARRIYEAIVARQRDPVLLEFAGLGAVRTRAFPVPAGGTMRVRVRYEHVMPREGERFDYVLPRAEALPATVPWTIDVAVESARNVSLGYSPSHKIERTSEHPRRLQVRVADCDQTAPGPFRLSFVRTGEADVASTLYAYPEGDGGYFMLLLSPPADAAGSAAIRRDLTLVLDISGSMKGEKIEQVQAAARQIVAGLRSDETVRLISYANTVSTSPVRQADADTKRHVVQQIDGLRAGGSTNLHGALLAALGGRTETGLPLILFLTDGLPTAGETSETAIRALTNVHPEHRVFPIGVGVDVNAPLLDALANDSRGAATFVLPGHDVEAAVAGVFDKLDGPVLAGPVLSADSPGRIADLQPTLLPDLFSGDQLIVLGRYTGTAPLQLNLTGNLRGTTRRLDLAFDPARARTEFDFVPRLWASRRIAELSDDIRRRGAAGEDAASPAVREMIDTIVSLSTEFGVLTEYTAFLADEATDLSNTSDVQTVTMSNYSNMAQQQRSGQWAVTQSMNIREQRKQTALNRSNSYLGADLQERSARDVYQVRDRAFFRRGGQWVDSRIVQSKAKPDREVVFGTPEFARLLDRLIAHNRQATVALPGDVLLRFDNETILIKRSQ